jgi:two-component system OmpR family response regulator
MDTMLSVTDPAGGFITRSPDKILSQFASNEASSFASANGGAGLGDAQGRVLVIEDDPALRRLITSQFEDQAFQVTALSGDEDFAAILDRTPARLIVLDVQLRHRDGFELLRQIRAGSDVPVIIVTCALADEIDRVVGLELGADDCLTKPFSPRELVARARAILRRHDLGRISAAEPGRNAGYRFGGWELRRQTRKLRDPSGAEVGLTNSEYTLLIAFLEAPGRLLSREQLLHKTRTHEDIFDRSIDVQVLRLRRKLETDPAQPQLIRTERGVGYMLDAAVERLF